MEDHGPMAADEISRIVERSMDPHASANPQVEGIVRLLREAARKGFHVQTENCQTSTYPNDDPDPNLVVLTVNVTMIRRRKV